MKETVVKGIYNSPEMQVLVLKEDIVRTSDGAQIAWDSKNWGERASFLNGGEF